MTSAQVQQSDRPRAFVCVTLLLAQVREVHGDLEGCLTEWVRSFAPSSPPAGSRLAALYAHAAIVEDITIQSLLRGVAPLFSSTWDQEGAARYSTVDLRRIRRYAREVFAATDAYLTTLPPGAETNTVDLSGMDLGRPTVAWVVSRFVILELAQIYGEILSILQSTETGLAAIPHGGSARRTPIVAHSPRGSGVR